METVNTITATFGGDQQEEVSGAEGWYTVRECRRRLFT